jgi:hypothetical protein
MKLKDLLARGESVVGTALDRRLKPMSDMPESAAKRLRYMNRDGYWSERGYLRATSLDWHRFEQSHDAFLRAAARKK